MIETVKDLMEALSELEPDAAVRIPMYQQSVDDNGDIIDGVLEWFSIESLYGSDERVDLEISMVGEQF